MKGFLAILLFLLGAAAFIYWIIGPGDDGPPPSMHTFAPRDRHDKPSRR